MNNADIYRYWLARQGRPDSQANRKAFRKISADQRQHRHSVGIIARYERLGQGDPAAVERQRTILRRLNIAA